MAAFVEKSKYYFLYLRDMVDEKENADELFQLGTQYYFNNMIKALSEKSSGFGKKITRSTRYFFGQSTDHGTYVALLRALAKNLRISVDPKTLKESKNILSFLHVSGYDPTASGYISSNKSVALRIFNEEENNFRTPEEVNEGTYKASSYQGEYDAYMSVIKELQAFIVRQYRKAKNFKHPIVHKSPSLKKKEERSEIHIIEPKIPEIKIEENDKPKIMMLPPPLPENLLRGGEEGGKDEKAERREEHSLLDQIRNKGLQKKGKYNLKKAPVLSKDEQIEKANSIIMEKTRKLEVLSNEKITLESELSSMVKTGASEQDKNDKRNEIKRKGEEIQAEREAIQFQKRKLEKLM